MCCFYICLSDLILIIILLLGRHEAFVKSKCVQEIYDNLSDRKITIQAGELIKMEEASKVLHIIFLLR